MRKRQLIRACVEEAPDPDRFRELCRLLEATVHHRHRRRLESLEELYAPVDPDADTVDKEQDADGEGLQRLEDGLVELLEEADFEEISREQVHRALEESALLNVHMQVDLDEYERVLFYGRGADRRRETVSNWLGLRERQLEFTNYERVVVYVRRKAAGDGESPVVMKMFRNVPEHDIEMLLPEPAVKMRTRDRLFVGVPAVISGGLLLTTKAGPQLLLLGALVAFWLGLRDREVNLDQRTVLASLMGLLAVGGFIWRQVDKFRSRKMELLKDISERLYFKSLDNGAGVIHHLLDEAEDQECREAILALFLLHEADGALTREELDERAEKWIDEHTGRDVDFEVRDALDKLVEIRVLEQDADDRLSVVPLGEALERLDEAWDSEFDYA